MRYWGSGVISQKSLTMRYCSSGVLSHEICIHEILWSGGISHNICNHGILGIWCNISRNLQPYCSSGVISHKICNYEKLGFWCNISTNLWPWDIVVLVYYLTKSASMRYCGLGNISQDFQPRDIVVLVISREILSQCDLIIQIIKNNQINKINQVKLAHHRTDFGLVCFVLWYPSSVSF